MRLFFSILLFVVFLGSSVAQERAANDVSTDRDSSSAVLRSSMAGSETETAKGVEQARAKADSLLNLIQAAKQDTVRVKYLNKLAWELKYINPDTALYYARQALSLSEKPILKEPRLRGSKAEGAGWEKGIVNSHHTLAWILFLKGNYPLALDHNNKVLKIKTDEGDIKGIARTLGSIGNIYYEQGDYPKTLEYYFKAMKMDEELENNDGISRHLANIGSVYISQNDYPKALEYYVQALKINNKLLEHATHSGNADEVVSFYTNVASNLISIGNIYRDREQSDYAKSLEYFLKALKIGERLADKFKIALALGNIGDIYEKQDNHVEALKYLFKANNIFEEIGFRRYTAIALGKIGSLYIKQKKYMKAEDFLVKAQEVSSEIKALSLIKSHHEKLSTIYELTGRYKNAYWHYQAYSSAKDSLFNEDKSKEIGKLEAKYEFEKAEEERKRLDEDRRAASATAERRRNNLQYSGILIFIVLLFAGVFALGKFSIPVRLAEGMIFFSFLLFFEFTLVMLDPYIEKYSAGAPAIKLAFNAVLAGLIFPMHSFFESKLKSRIVKAL